MKLSTSKETFKTLFMTLVALTAVMIGAEAFAGAGAGGGTTQANTTDFVEIWTLLTGWTTGVLGKTIAVSFILVGIIGGLTRQSLMAFATGVGAGVGLLYFPTIIDTIFSASIIIS